MTEERNQILRYQVRQVRIDLLRILDWMERELTQPQPRDESQAAATKSKAAVMAPPALEDRPPLDERHYWILSQLDEGVKLTRRQVMEKFGYSVRHAKRILRTLTSRGLIRFEREPRPGRYTLCDKPGREAQ